MIVGKEESEKYEIVEEWGIDQKEVNAFVSINKKGSGEWKNQLRFCFVKVNFCSSLT